MTLQNHPLFPTRFAGDSALPGRMETVVRCLTSAGFNLTAITDPDEILEKHILDSLLAADALAAIAGDAPARLLDVGSGAGFPAMPIAAACPLFSVTAMDSTAKKCQYMKGTAGKAGIGNFTAVSGRAEELARTAMRESFDFVTARAVANLPVLAELCLPFVKVGGVFLALKGANAENELAAARAGIAKLGGKVENSAEYRIPCDPAPRFLLTIRKVSPTPAAYPRHYSQIAKKPL